jgi:hypothetical protein
MVVAILDSGRNGASEQSLTQDEFQAALRRILDPDRISTLILRTRTE